MISITKIFTLKLQITIFLNLASFLLYSQHGEDGGERYMSSFAVECSPSDYQFQIGSILYDAENTKLWVFKKSGKGFVCETDLPVVVTIFSKITGTPITATDVVWSGSIDGTFGAINQGLVTNSHFMNNDFVNFGATFTDNGQKVELIDFKLSKDVKVVALKSKNPGDYFDTVRDSSGNYINEYWPSHSPSKEKPWLFVPPSGTQNLELSVKSKSGKKPGKDAYKAMTVNPNGAGMSITPNTFTGDNSGFAVGQTINTSTPYPFVSSCTDTVAYIYSQPGQSYGLEFKLIAFTHDDQQINFGPVASDTTTCVTVGADGFYTEAYRRRLSDGKLVGPSYVSNSDSIVKSPGNILVTKIVAGSDRICNTTVPANYTYFSKMPNINQWLLDCNSIYNKIGVSFYNYSLDTLYVPDFWIQNRILELSEVGQIGYIANYSGPDSIIVYLTDDVVNINNGGLNVLGAAEAIGTPKVAMAFNADGFTLAHEIGHGKFSLRHPDISDKDHLGGLDGDIPPSNGPFNVKDKLNFMYFESSARTNVIRHYQWKKILTGTYNN